MNHNSAYFKIFLIISVLFLTATQARAQVPADITRTVRIGSMLQGRVSIGYLAGEGNEYIYDTSWDGEIGSKLIWELKDVCMAGLGLSLQPYKGMTFSVNGWTSVNDGSGEMDDYDWFVRYGDWTDWSHSSVVNAEGRVFDADLEITLMAPRPWKITGILGYRYERWKWDDYGNGPYIYSSYGFRDRTGYFPEELGITWEQTYKTPYIGIGIEGRFKALTIEICLKGSPFVQKEDVDHHYQRDMVFSGSYPDGDMVNIEVNGFYAISSRCGIELGYSFQKYDKMTGDLAVSSGDGSSALDRGAADAELEYQMVSISVVYAF